jgi:tyrosinase
MQFVAFLSLLFLFRPTDAQQQQQTTRCPLTRERKPWKDLTCREQQEYYNAIERLKQNGVYDEFVRVHIQADHAAHGVAEFLPWHRWYIFQFESAMRSVSNDPCVTLPYWDWENDAWQGPRASILQDFGARYVGQDPRTGQCRWPATNGGCLQRDFEDPSIRLWTQPRLVALVSTYTQYADDFPNNPNRNNGFRAELEGGAHAAVHNLIGGHMLDQNSPNDPLFFLHHANVDRIWANWQDLRGHSTSMENPDVPQQYEGRLLNAPMSFPETDRWNFRTPSGNFPTPRDVLSNSDTIRVRYIQDQWIPNHRPDRRWFSSRPRFSNGCGRRRRDLQPVEGEYGIGRDYNSTGTRQSFLRRQQLEPGQADKDAENQSSSLCQQLNTFQHLGDKNRWNSLCLQHLAVYDENDNYIINDMIQHVATTMAVEECESLGNPKSATNEQWIERMNMANEHVTFECFHMPDSPGDEGRTSN